jgi:hypothetical protein
MDATLPPSARAADVFVPPPVSEWPNLPVLITQGPTGIVPPPRSTIPIHKSGPNEASEFAVESELFVGKAYIAVKGVHNFPEAYFEDKKRLFYYVLQGRFKTPDLSFAVVQTGQLFNGPLHLIPPKLILIPFELMLDKLQPNFRMDLNTDRPYVLSALMATMQQIGMHYISCPCID